MVSIDLSIETVFIEKTRHLVCKVAILQQLFSNNFWTEISQIGHSAKSALLSYLLRLIWLSDKSAKPQNQENHALSLKTPKSPDVNVQCLAKKLVILAIPYVNEVILRE